ncbi:MAG: cyclase family protein [Planctomycetaceae bacterium]|nr:cyclase family protein [Planctomycetaceae bacterium]
MHSALRWAKPGFLLLVALSPILLVTRFETPESTSLRAADDAPVNSKLPENSESLARADKAVSKKTEVQGETPIGPKWWPSRWGADDQRGAANMMTPERVLEATKLITTGKTYQLGRVYERDMPTFPFRTFRLTIPAFRAPTKGSNQQVGRDEFFVGEIGQMGTQMDGLGHVGCRLPTGDTYYNGITSAEMEDAYGLTKLGIENVGVFFTRGVLIDVVGMRKVERLPVGYEISLDELQSALAAQNTEIRKGDVVLIRTGHGTLWKKDNETFNSGEPGIGLEAAKWLISQEITMVGSDNWGIEVDPPPNKQRPIEVHQWFLTKNGIYFLENLDLEQLAADKAYEFAFIFSPLRLKGATGSPGNPIAVK